MAHEAETDEHPTVTKTRAQIQKARRDIEKNVKSRAAERLANKKAADQSK